MAQTPAPARSSLRYPFWAHANHPQLGAEMAAAAGCDPLAVTLIRRHQETGRRRSRRSEQGAEEQMSTILTDDALRTADDDNDDNWFLMPRVALRQLYSKPTETGLASQWDGNCKEFL